MVSHSYRSQSGTRVPNLDKPRQTSTNLRHRLRPVRCREVRPVKCSGGAIHTLFLFFVLHVSPAVFAAVRATSYEWNIAECGDAASAL